MPEAVRSRRSVAPPAPVGTPAPELAVTPRPPAKKLVKVEKGIEGGPPQTSILVPVPARENSPVGDKPYRRLGHVALGAAITQNMGNYSSAKVWVEVEVPCDGTSVADYDTAKAQAGELLDKYLDEEYRAATQS